MNKIPFFQETAFLETLPARVSAQCERQSTSLHMHRHVQLVYSLSGELSHVIGDTPFSQPPGASAAVLPYTPHSTSLLGSEDTPVIIFISFYADFLTSRGYDFFPFGKNPHFEGFKIPKFHVPKNEEEAQTSALLVRKMRSEFDLGEDADFDKIAALVADFLRCICTEKLTRREGALSVRQAAGVNKALRYIEENYASKIKIDELSALAGMSRSTFTVRFREFTGFSVSDFILAVRLYRASVLINGTGSLIMDEIAAKCGLYDHTNLTRVFKKAFGMSPTEYRRENQTRFADGATEKDNGFDLYKWISE